MTTYGISLRQMQLLAYLIGEKGYTLIAVQQRPNDLWLIYPRNRQYPILHVCDREDKEVKQDEFQLRQVHRALCDLIHRECPIVVLNVCREAHSFKDSFVQQITFDASIDPAFQHAFPSVMAQFVEAEDEQAEKARLAKQLENTHKKGSLWRERLALMPRYALFLILLVTAASLIMFMARPYLQDLIFPLWVVEAFLDQLTIASWPMLLQLPALFFAAALCDGLYHKGTVWIAVCSAMIAALFQVMSGCQDSGIAAMILGLWCAGIFDVGLIRAYRHPLIRRQMFRHTFWIMAALLVPGNEWIVIFGGILGGLLTSLCFSGFFQQQLRRHAIAAIAALLAVVSIWMVFDHNEWEWTWKHAQPATQMNSKDYTAVQ